MGTKEHTSKWQWGTPITYDYSRAFHEIFHLYAVKDHLYYLGQNFRNDYLCKISYKIPQEVYHTHSTTRSLIRKYRHESYKAHYKKSGITIWGDFNAITF